MALPIQRAIQWPSPAAYFCNRTVPLYVKGERKGQGVLDESSDEVAALPCRVRLYICYLSEAVLSRVVSMRQSSMPNMYVTSQCYIWFFFLVGTLICWCEPRPAGSEPKAT